MATNHPYLSAVRQAELKSIAEALLAPYKGILAADEATPAMGQRLASIGVENTEENRRRYRQILFATPKEGCIDGYFLLQIAGWPLKCSMICIIPFHVFEN